MQRIVLSFVLMSCFFSQILFAGRLKDKREGNQASHAVPLKRTRATKQWGDRESILRILKEFKGKSYDSVVASARSLEAIVAKDRDSLLNFGACVLANRRMSFFTKGDVIAAQYSGSGRSAGDLLKEKFSGTWRNRKSGVRVRINGGTLRIAPESGNAEVGATLQVCYGGRQNEVGLFGTIRDFCALLNGTRVDGTIWK